MRIRMAVVLAAGLALPVGTVMLAAPGQDRQAPPASGSDRPGQPTRGAILIENRGEQQAIPVIAAQAVPVVVQSVVTTAPIAVRLSGNTIGAAPPPLTIRRVAQEWDYQTVTVPPDASAQDVTRLLSAPGSSGWEPAGVQITGRGGSLVVLKRPRS